MNRIINLLEPLANFKRTKSIHPLSVILAILFLIVTPRLGYSNSTVSVSPASLAFGLHTVGTSSAALSVTVTDTGKTSLTFSSLTVSGKNSKDFSETNSCGRSIAAGAGCTIQVVFKPTAAGTRSALLGIYDNASRSAQQINLSGTGASGSAAASVSSSSLAFGSQAVGATSAARVVTLSNSGSAALSITGVSISGTNASDFAQSNNCGSSLAATSSCSISVTFTPSASGSRSASISISNSVSLQTVTLSGTGTSASASVTLSPSSLSFSSEPVTLSSATQTVTLTNSGSAALSISGFTLTGTNSTDFTQNNNCPASLAAGSNCSIVVLFAPSASGARSASISIADNAGSNPQTVALSGTGAHDVVLTWTASTTSGVIGYNVYRGTVSGGESTTPVNSSPVTSVDFTDPAVSSGSQYYYTLTAVSSNGTEQSASSSETAVQVPTP